MHANPLFPVCISYSTFQKNEHAFLNHWHEHNEFLYIQKGEGIIECNSMSYHVKPGDLIIVNSNELHSGYSLSNNFPYYCIIVDPSALHSSFVGLCEIKYIAPITQNLILFENILKPSTDVHKCLDKAIEEYENKLIGYELSIKSHVYEMFTLLLRHHVKTMITYKEYIARKKNLERLTPVFKYIEENYHTKISVSSLADLCHISYYRFCHIFKDLTDQTVTDYINSLRISKAASLICDTTISITEAALEVGFDDINYFSRLFRKYKNMSPSEFRIHQINREES